MSCLRLNTFRWANKRTITSFLVGTSAVFGAYSLFNTNGLIRSEERSNINVNNSVNPLPRQLSLSNGAKFDLLGYGERRVSFLRLKVYLLGVYIAEEDEGLIKTVLNSKFMETFYENSGDGDHKKNLEKGLNDPKVSNLLIRNALLSGVKFTARICALRNTDLGHLRDGFIRTIKNSTHFKELNKSDDETIPKRLDDGLKELRQIFGSFQIKAKQNSNLFMEMNKEGGIKVSLEVYDGAKHLDPRVLGTIKEPMIAQLLFESYLGAEKPLIQQVHETAMVQLLSLF